MPIMVIMQGHSGSGKSTLAKVIAEVLDAKILSTDNFFMYDGEYHFDPLLLSKAHKWNQNLAQVEANLRQNVVIDNTNIRKWEASPYVKTGVDAGYTIKFVRATGNYQNTHGVPDEVVQRMKDNMEDLSVDGCLKALR